ncbi:MAG: hypothetical protein Q9227_007924 [Pyrenula ochraceoflavens]
MFLGEYDGVEDIQREEHAGADWTKICLGSFYVKPNYPGRSSHVCNGGFLVTDAARNKGVGKSMGESYLEWAPQLGYSYSVFNLVYESNTASTRIWDSLGFKRIGRVPGCGNLKSSSEPVDAIIYGRELGGEGDDFVSEERFEKIRYYLKHGKYPAGADRAEKSRLRSAATHYKLVPSDDADQEKLMLKGKEVISDPHKQYEIARNIHLSSHAGINKTTAVIAVKYHWVRIKETVSLVIKNCTECKEAAKVPTVFPEKKAKEPHPPPLVLRQNPSTPSRNTFSPEENHRLQAQEFAMKQTPFGSHNDQSQHDLLPHLDEYSEMALDPRLMQELQMSSRFGTSQDPYSQTDLGGTHGLPHSEFNPDHHPGNFHVGDDSMMAEAAAAALDHEPSMDLVDESHLDHDEHLPQHLLASGYVDGEGHTPYDQ